MKLLTYKTQISQSRLGFIHNNKVVDIEDFGDISNFPLPDSMLELIDMGIEVIEYYARRSVNILAPKW